MDYKDKYLKYKNKYLSLKGGAEKATISALSEQIETLKAKNAQLTQESTKEGWTD